MNYTNNYNFALPAGTDDVDISVLNDNFTDIDSQLKLCQLGEDDLQEQITQINKEVAGGQTGTLAFTVAENTTNIETLDEAVTEIKAALQMTDEYDFGPSSDEPMDNYITERTDYYKSGANGNSKWEGERWNNGIVRICGYETFTDVTLSNGVILYFPEDYFIRAPYFVSVTLMCSTTLLSYQVTTLTKDAICIRPVGVDNSASVTNVASLTVYVEARADGTLG